MKNHRRTPKGGKECIESEFTWIRVSIWRNADKKFIKDIQMFLGDCYV